VKPSTRASRGAASDSNGDRSTGGARPATSAATISPVIGASSTPFRWCPVAMNNPSTSVAPRSGSSSAVYGLNPDQVRRTVPLAELGQEPRRGHEQIADRARVRARAVSDELDGRSDQDPPIVARREVAVGPVHDAAERLRRQLHLDHLSARGQDRSRRQRRALDERRPAPRGHDDLIGLDAIAPGELDAARAAADHRHASDVLCGAEPHARAFERDAQRACERGRIDAHVVRKPHGARDLAR